MATHAPQNQRQLARQLVAALPVNGVEDFPPKVLQEMLNFLPEAGLDIVAEEICSCNDERELRALGEHYITAVFKPMKAGGGKTPKPSPSPDTDEQDEENNMFDTLNPPQTSTSLRSLQKACLPRDGYRCVVTRIRSTETPDSHLPEGHDPANTAHTEISHIIPLSLAQYGDSEQAHSDATRTWTSLRRIFPSLNQIADRLERINESSNLFTASLNVHITFGSFNLALEPVAERQNTYRVRYWRGVVDILPRLPQPPVISLTDHMGANSGLPLPDPELFRVHYIVAQVLNATGLAEALDSYFDDYYSLGGLATDGSTTLPFLIEVP